MIEVVGSSFLCGERKFKFSPGGGPSWIHWMPRPRRPLGDDVLPSPISQSLTKPLCIAAQAGAAIRALLAEGRDPDEFERRAEVSVFPLFFATAGNHLAAIEALISGGCNVNQYGGP